MQMLIQGHSGKVRSSVWRRTRWGGAVDEVAAVGTASRGLGTERPEPGLGRWCR